MDDPTLQNVTTASSVTGASTSTLSTPEAQVSNSASLVTSGQEHEPQLMNLLARQTEEKQLTSTANEADEKQRRQLRLCFFLVLTLWTLAAIATPVAVFCITRSPLSFSLFSTLAPPVYLWYRFARYIFMDERLFELEKMKIQRTIEKSTTSRSK